jgi:hypothetical protein
VIGLSTKSLLWADEAAITRVSVVRLDDAVDALEEELVGVGVLELYRFTLLRDLGLFLVGAILHLEHLLVLLSIFLVIGFLLIGVLLRLFLF